MVDGFGVASLVISLMVNAASLIALFRVRAENRKLAADAAKAEAEGRKADADARKSDADAASIITAAAAALVDPLRQEVGNLRGRVEEAHRRVGVLQGVVLSQDHLAHQHSAWDDLVEDHLDAAGIDYPPRPPLRASSGTTLHQPDCVVVTMVTAANDRAT